MNVPRVSHLLTILLMGVLLLSACASDAENGRPAVVSESTSVTSAAAEIPQTAVPTATALPSATSMPTATPSPTITAVPSATPSPQPTPLGTSEAPVNLQINADGSGDLATLEEAIAFAVGGSTIVLSGGVFEISDTLELDKPLEISGAGVNETRILSRAPSAVISYSGDGSLSIREITISHVGNFPADVIRTHSGELNLADCRLEGGVRESGQINFGAGLFLTGGAVVNATNCEIVNNEGVGVELINQAQVSLENNTVSGNGAGILFDGSSSGLVTGNLIEKNRDVGIYVFALARTEIKDNHILNNEGIGIRFQLDDESGGLVQGNVLLDNDTGENGDPGTDIIIFNSYVPALLDNVCSGDGHQQNAAGVDADVDADIAAGGIVLFNTSLNQPTNLVVEGNECAYTECGLAAGADEFEPQCVSIGP